MTIYYYVGSPVSGTQGGIDCYCGNCSDNVSPCNSGGHCTSCGSSQCIHNPGILCCPVDIMVTTGKTAVKLYVNSTVKSVITTQITGGLCLNPPPSGYSWVNDGIRVDLYCNYDGLGLVGSVYYGHIWGDATHPKISNGVHNYPNGLVLGYVGPGNCACNTTPDCNPGSCQSGCSCNNTQRKCYCSCYDGLHVHMTRSSSGTTYYRTCGVSITTNNLIYTFSSPSCPTI